MLFLWLQGYCLKQTNVGLFGHFEVRDVIEDVANEQVIFIISLSLRFSGQRRDKHFEEHELDVRDGAVQLVGRVEDAQDEEHFVFGTLLLKLLL